VLKVLILLPGPASVMQPLTAMFYYGIVISVFLGVLNLIPIHPLDGSHIVSGILPAHQAQVYSRHERYGFIILLVLLFTGILIRIIEPVSIIILNVIIRFFGF
jgi:Zn-dependent protease